MTTSTLPAQNKLAAFAFNFKAVTTTVLDFLSGLQAPATAKTADTGVNLVELFRLARGHDTMSPTLAAELRAIAGRQ